MEHLDHPLQDFVGPVNESDWPVPVCPTCGKGTLPWVEPDLFESPASKRAVDSHPDWGPEFTAGTFLLVSKCNNHTCVQVVIFTGRYFVGTNERYDQFTNELEMHYVNPPLPLMRVPKAAPDPVRREVANASKDVFSVPSAAAGRLRAAVERVLDNQGIPPVSRVKGEPRNLHDRIVLFTKQNQDLGDAMTAIRFIGNEGAHDDTLTGPDVLDGAVVLERILRLLYDGSDAATLARIKEIIRDRGVRQPKP